MIWMAGRFLLSHSFLGRRCVSYGTCCACLGLSRSQRIDWVLTHIHMSFWCIICVAGNPARRWLVFNSRIQSVLAVHGCESSETNVLEFVVRCKFAWTEIAKKTCISGCWHSENDSGSNLTQSLCKYFSIIGGKSSCHLDSGSRSLQSVSYVGCVYHRDGIMCTTYVSRFVPYIKLHADFS